jgi:hypothetical protein
MKKILFINIFLIFIIISLIEGSLRLLVNITPQGLSDGVINYLDTPKFNNPGVAGKRVFGKAVFTDNNGFRISKNQKIKKGVIDNVYFVGGSVTFGNGVKQSDTFTGILNNKIKNLNIINAGVIGSNLKNNLEIIKKKIKTNNTKYIFVNFSLDDIVNSENSLENNKINQKDIIAKFKNNYILRYINGFIRSKSVTYVLVKGLLFNASQRYYLHALNTYKEKENLNSFEKIMELYQVRNIYLNNKIIFLIIPYSFQIKDNNCQNKDLAERIIEKSIIKKNIKLIKFKEIFCDDINKKNIFLKFDPSHLSNYGHKLVAKTLREELR